MLIRFAGVIAVASALAACGVQGRPAAGTAVPAPGPSKGDTPTRDFVIGKWGTNGNCESSLDLRADGTTDGPVGDWTYSDGVIGFTDVPELRVTVTVIDDESMDSTNADGDKAIMTRCP
ncbi:hypothetical protein [Mycolicibacterium sp.]|uniref:hypothetical protein n=1 Tax=Mycolicibacterium sp. TaxID=2320850 RepID=UPI0025D5C819|nr:hypothetical protein [Mycolicibacterium sp.]